MRVHLVDGTYELFRQHFGSAARHSNSHPFAAAAGVVTSKMALIEDGATHIGVASDHTIPDKTIAAHASESMERQ